MVQPLPTVEYSSEFSGRTLFSLRLNRGSSLLTACICCNDCNSSCFSISVAFFHERVPKVCCQCPHGLRSIDSLLRYSSCGRSKGQKRYRARGQSKRRQPGPAAERVGEKGKPRDHSHHDYCAETCSWQRGRPGRGIHRTEKDVGRDDTGNSHARRAARESNPRGPTSLSAHEPAHNDRPPPSLCAAHQLHYWLLPAPPVSPGRLPLRPSQVESNRTKRVQNVQRTHTKIPKKAVESQWPCTRPHSKSAARDTRDGVEKTHAISRNMERSTYPATA